MYRLRSVVSVVVAAMFVAAPSVSGAQTPTAQPAGGDPQESAIPKSSTVLHASANLVLVDVVVTDHDKPVHGIERSRFHVYEDGHQQAFASFDEHPAPTMGTADFIRMDKPSTLPPHSYTNRPAYPDAGAVNVLLLDGLNTPLSDQKNVRLKMIDFVKNIKPCTSLAIFGLSSRLRMIVGFTTDMTALTAALKSARTSAQQSSVLDSNRFEQEHPTGVTNSAMHTTSTSEDLAAYWTARFEEHIGHVQIDQRVEITLEALQQLARYLSALPGRKNVIWFSGSFPKVIFSMTDPRNYTEQPRETAKMLSDARVSIYPVDARGLTMQHGEQTELEQSTMEQIAQDTGGKAYVNTNDFANAVADVVENGNSYYTIGYVPDRKHLDGQFHTIKVTVDQGSYKLAFRRGYYADAADKPSPDAPGQPNPMLTAVLPGAPPATQIIFTAQVLTVTDPLVQGAKLPTGSAGELSSTLKGPIARYVVNFTLNPGTLSLDTASDGTRHGKIELAVIAYDADGNRVNYTDHQSQLTIKPEVFERVAANGINILVPIDLPRGENSLRIAVKDHDAGRIGSLEVAVPVTSN